MSIQRPLLGGALVEQPDYFKSGFTWWDLASVDLKRKVFVLWRDEGRFHPFSNADMNPTREISFATGQDPTRLVTIKKAHKECKSVEVHVNDETGFIFNVRVRE